MRCLIISVGTRTTQADYGKRYGASVKGAEERKEGVVAGLARPSQWRMNTHDFAKGGGGHVHQGIIFAVGDGGAEDAFRELVRDEEQGGYERQKSTRGDGYEAK